MAPRILFTSPCRSDLVLLDRYAPTDHLAYRLTRNQEPLTLHGHAHVSPLHLLAQNVSPASTVLEYPSFEDLEAELEHGYEIVAVSFKAVHADVLHDMCVRIRRISPQSTIVVGGYGAVCGPELFKEPRWAGLIDRVCYGEGIGFMRRLLGEDPSDEVTCRLPKEGANLPWLQPRSTGTTGLILSGIGCTFRCHFCATSASTGGQYVEVLDAGGIYRSMRRYWEETPLTSTVTIYDENFLQQREKVDALGRLIRADEAYGLRHLNYAAFGSISEIAKYEPDELLLNGVDALWVGVESKLTRLKKRKGADPEDIFPALHSVGIKTIGSWILGEDAQTPDTLGEDMDYFVGLDSTFQQLSIMTVFPSLPLWRRLKKQGRIPEGVRWEDQHLFGHTFTHPHFTHPQMVEHLDRMYTRIHEQNGPALMKVLEVSLNGYEHCMRSSHPALKEHKSKLFRKRCMTYAPLMRTALAHAPSERVRQRVERLRDRHADVFGKPPPAEERMAERIQRLADEEMARLRQGPPPIRHEPFRRYTYAERDARSAHRPYEVAYPTAPPPALPVAACG
jgi:hypothetical protein